MKKQGKHIGTFKYHHKDHPIPDGWVWVGLFKGHHGAKGYGLIKEEL